MVTDERFYPPPIRFTAVDATAGNATLAWVNPPDRYDFHSSATARGGMILRRAAGSTPPTGPTDGTGITLSGDFAESKTDDPGAGEFSYALFAGYDETLDASNDRFSAAATATVTVT